MARFLSPQQGIKELVHRLEQDLASLASEIRTNSPRMRIDAVWSIPYRNQATVDVNKAIEIEHLAGEQAVKAIIDGLTATRIEAGRQHPRETFRAPGAVGMPTDWVEQLAALNQQRAEIHTLVEQIPEQYERIKIWRTMPYLSSLQVLRRSWLASNPKKIRFYWDTAPSVKPYLVQQLIDGYTNQLKKLYGVVPDPDQLAPEDKNLKLVLGLKSLESLPPNEKVVIFRQGKPHVRARVTYKDEAPEIRPCPTCIVYDINHEGPSIKPLLNWEPGRSDRPRSNRARIETEPFFEGLYLYRYLPAYR
jgi:hypothetical protein